MARRSPTGGASVLRDAFQTQLWPLPVIGVTLSLILGVGVPVLDSVVDRGLPDALTFLLFSGGPDAARTVLSAVAGSLITVTSLTFSLTVVTLQLASSQFSPRLLRTFSRDRFVHVTLALFLGTFTYSLVTLRAVRNGGQGGTDFVPQIAVSLAVLATVASVIGLVLFLAHLSRQIRVESILEKVHTEAEGTIERMLAPRGDGPRAVELSPTPPPGAAPLLAAESGFLVSVDEQDLMDAAVDAGAVVLIEGFPGGSVVAGTPIGRAWSVEGQRLPDSAMQQLHDSLERGVNVGPERTAAQDIAFGLRQLTDVANKALSPGINDPTTAVHALSHISSVLCSALERELGPRLLRDDADRVRVVLVRPDFADLLDGAIAQPRRFASSSPNVLGRIAQLLREAAWRAHEPAPQQAILRQAERLQQTVDGAGFDEDETEELHRAITRVREAIVDRW